MSEHWCGVKAMRAALGQSQLLLAVYADALSGIDSCHAATVDIS